MHGSRTFDDNNDPTSESRPEKMMVSGLVRLEKEDDVPIEVKRGMSIRASDGREVGKVAAVVVNTHSQQVTHIILGRQVRAPDYRLVPVGLIKRVNAGTIWLRVLPQVVKNLPQRQSP